MGTKLYDAAIVGSGAARSARGVAAAINSDQIEDDITRALAERSAREEAVR